LDQDIVRCAGSIHIFKKDAAQRSGRAEITHPRPSISEAYLEEFLDGLGASGNDWDLSPVEIRLFEFLRRSLISSSSV
jgi:hypothetical protein